MPLYEYQCRSCGQRFETLRPISQRSQPARCPHCGHEHGEPVLSAPAAFTHGHQGGACSSGFG